MAVSRTTEEINTVKNTKGSFINIKTSGQHKSWLDTSAWGAWDWNRIMAYTGKSWYLLEQVPFKCRHNEVISSQEKRGEQTEEMAITQPRLVNAGAEMVGKGASYLGQGTNCQTTRLSSLELYQRRDPNLNKTLRACLPQQDCSIWDTSSTASFWLDKTPYAFCLLGDSCLMVFPRSGSFVLLL